MEQFKMYQDFLCNFILPNFMCCVNDKINVFIIFILLKL